MIPTLKLSRLEWSGMPWAECFASDGVTPVAITGIADADESQILATGSGVPVSPGVVLGNGSVQTAPIAWRRVPPSTEVLFTAAVKPGVRYHIQACQAWRSSEGPGSVTWTVYDGALPVQSATLDMATQSSAEYQPTNPNGVSTALFRAIGDHTPSGTTLSIGASGPDGQYIYPSAVRLVSADGAGEVIAQVGDGGQSIYQADERAGSIAVGDSRVKYDKPGYYNDGAFPIRCLAAPGQAYQAASTFYIDAAETQAKLDAAFGAGSVVASTSFSVGTADRPGVPTPPPPRSIALRFGGPQAGKAIGVLTSSDPLSSCTIAHPGGQPPRVTKPDGTVIPIARAKMAIGDFPAAAGKQSFLPMVIDEALKGIALKFNAPAGWLMTTAGPAPAVVDYPLPAWVPPDLPTPSMPVGMGFGQETPYAGSPQFRNRARATPGTGLYDSAAYPIYLQLRNADAANIPIPSGPDDPAGLWTIRWSGRATPVIRCDPASGPSPKIAVRVRSPGVGTFAVPHEAGYPNTQIAIANAASAGLTSLAMPGMDGLATTIHPDAARAHGLMACARMLDPSGAAFSDARTFADLNNPAPGRFGNVQVNVPIASIVPDTSGHFPASGGPAFLVTCTRAHGLNERTFAFAKSRRHLTGRAGDASFGDPGWTLGGRPYAGDQYGLDHVPDGYIEGYVHVTSPTAYVVQLGAKAAVVATKPLNAAGATLQFDRQPGWPPAEQAAIYRDLQAIRPGYLAYWNIPFLLDDDAVDRYFDIIATVSGPAHVEPGNEVWNSSNPIYGQVAAMAPSLGLPASPDPVIPYMERSARMIARGRDRFVAAGRDPADIVWCIGVNGFDPGYFATSTAAYAVAKGMKPDKFVTAPYARPDLPSDPEYVQSPTLLSLLNGLTDAQSIDLTVAAYEYSMGPASVRAIRAVLDASGLKRADGSAVGIGCYEGGPDAFVPGYGTKGDLGKGQPAAVYARRARLKTHPAYCRIIYRFCQRIQAAGSSWFTQYLHSNNGPWQAIDHYNQPIGTGSASDPPGASQVAGGLAKFAADARAGTVTPSGAISSAGGSNATGTATPPGVSIPTTTPGSSMVPNRGR